MDTTQILPAVQRLLARWTERLEQPEENRLDVYLAADNIVEAVRALVTAGGWHLSAITGLDIPQTMQEDGKIEILYHFCQGTVVLTLRIQVPYGSPIAPSICPVIPAAVLYERELVEMLGVILEGTPMREKLLLPDDWPDGVYPMRKSFRGLE